MISITFEMARICNGRELKLMTKMSDDGHSDKLNGIHQVDDGSVPSVRFEVVAGGRGGQKMLPTDGTWNAIKAPTKAIDSLLHSNESQQNPHSHRIRGVSSHCPLAQRWPHNKFYFLRWKTNEPISIAAGECEIRCGSSSLSLPPAKWAMQRSRKERERENRREKKIERQREKIRQSEFFTNQRFASFLASAVAEYSTIPIQFYGNRCSSFSRINNFKFNDFANLRFAIRTKETYWVEEGGEGMGGGERGMITFRNNIVHSVE